MRNITFVQAMNEALTEELRQNPKVFMMGEDIELSIFGTTKGLKEEFGSERVFNTPITEEAVVGCALGASLMGMRPIVDLMTANFMYMAMDQFVNQAGKMRYMYGSQTKTPVVFIASNGAFGSAGAHHSDNPYPMFMNAGGVKIVLPSNPRSAKGLLKAAIRDDNPVLYFAPVALLANDKGEVPEEEYITPLGKAEVLRPGKDITVVALGAMVRQALAAADQLAGENIQLEIVDPRTLLPMDWPAILESAQKTGRLIVMDEAHRTCGAAAEIAAYVSEQCFGNLKSPVKRITAPDVPVPYSPILEAAVIPNKDDIVAAARRMVVPD